MVPPDQRVAQACWNSNIIYVIFSHK